MDHNPASMKTITASCATVPESCEQGTVAAWPASQAVELQPSHSSEAAIFEITDLDGLGDMPNVSAGPKRTTAEGLPASSDCTDSKSFLGSKNVDTVRAQARARRGEATAKHSICERTRRTRISDSMSALHKLIPDASKTIKTSMLDDVIQYVCRLQMRLQMECLSKLEGSNDNAQALPVPNAAVNEEEWRRSCKRMYVNKMIERVLDPLEDRLAEAERQFMSRLAHPSHQLSLVASYLASVGLTLTPISHLPSVAKPAAADTTNHP